MNPNQYRKNHRLEEYDYASTGAYFITLNSYEKKPYFGTIIGERVQLSQYGQIIRDEWLRTNSIRTEVQLDAFSIMPDHFHAILFITSPDITNVGAHGRAPLQTKGNPNHHFRPPKSLGSLISGFKASVTTRINTLNGSPGTKIWQRNYYDHIIRNEEDLQRIREYIARNPYR